MATSCYLNNISSLLKYHHYFLSQQQQQQRRRRRLYCSRKYWIKYRTIKIAYECTQGAVYIREQLPKFVNEI